MDDRVHVHDRPVPAPSDPTGSLRVARARSGGHVAGRRPDRGAGRAPAAPTHTDASSGDARVATGLGERSAGGADDPRPSGRRRGPAERGAPRVRPPDGTPTVSVCTTRAAVQAVLAGRRRLADAVRADEVRVEGRLPDLVALLEALEAFVHGAVRCDKIARLYDDFQREGAAR